MKGYRTAWTASILVIVLVVILPGVLRFFGIEVSDTVTRIMGVLDLIAIVTLVYSSVKMKIWKKNK